MPTKMTAKEHQIFLNDLINKSGVNLVTCGNCGGVLLHKTAEETIECPHCNYLGEPCDFPDLIHGDYYKQ